MCAIVPAIKHHMMLDVLAGGYGAIDIDRLGQFIQQPMGLAIICVVFILICWAVIH